MPSADKCWQGGGLEFYFPEPGVKDDGRFGDGDEVSPDALIYRVRVRFSSQVFSLFDSYFDLG
jgi:hypothetical protein